MLAKRIIPCLDVKDGRTVKGVNFVQLTDAGDPVELAQTYSGQGADELLFLDITASHEKRKTLVDLVDRVARVVNIPFTVGGGVADVDDAYALLQAGADKVSINSAALKNPELITSLAERFGSQCIVLAIDAKMDQNGRWEVYLHGGRIPSGRDLFEWALEGQERGAGEILFTSMNHDGTRNGFANEALALLNSRLSIPLIASGGAGRMRHFYDAFVLGGADAALAASVFHFGRINIPELKKYLRKCSISIR
ncbi:MAG TPA: imidazole glycerol phosphate synthase subunit HisF [Bacteroidales bacterium]|nr:imidazole glycerol phosphate synthase subunit HisF [Bacteroidales bacterium]